MLPVGRKHSPVLLCWPRIREITILLPRVENMWQLKGGEKILVLALKLYNGILSYSCLHLIWQCSFYSVQSSQNNSCYNRKLVVIPEDVLCGASYLH